MDIGNFLTRPSTSYWGYFSANVLTNVSNWYNSATVNTSQWGSVQPLCAIQIDKCVRALVCCVCCVPPLLCARD